MTRVIAVGIALLDEGDLFGVALEVRVGDGAIGVIGVDVWAVEV